MFGIQNAKFLSLVVFVNLTLILTACSDSSSSNPPVINPPPASAPLNVQVVSGDDNSNDVENTISWTLDPAATDYTVYWDNVPGVTENSSVVVPTVQGTRYVTHSGVDVTEGNSYYYRVQADSAGGSSAGSVAITSSAVSSPATVDSMATSSKSMSRISPMICGMKVLTIAK